MKLHLGCGERYLDGYVNIDFPPAAHSVQTKSVADKFADILELSYEPGSIDEVRLHHVFEHFSRPVACALLAGWNSWIKDGGILHIEVPDFKRTARASLSCFRSNHKKNVASRHIFGSQESFWANHLAGYTAGSLSNLLKIFGFKAIEIKRNSWRGTYNIEIIARKYKTLRDKSVSHKIAEKYQALYLLDKSETEKRLLETWMNIYKGQVNKSLAYEPKDLSHHSDV